LQSVGNILSFLLTLALLILIARFILEWVRLLARDWRPSGVSAVLCEVIYSITDPPLRLVRGIIPPIRMGAAAIDLSPIILLIAIYLAMTLVQRIFI